MKNKLALVIFKYFPYGGLQRDLYNVAIELKKKDLELTIFCSEWVGHFPEDIEVRTIKPVGLTNHKKNQNFYEHFSIYRKYQMFRIISIIFMSPCARSSKIFINIS